MVIMLHNGENFASSNITLDCLQSRFLEAGLVGTDYTQYSDLSQILHSYHQALSRHGCVQC